MFLFTGTINGFPNPPNADRDGCVRTARPGLSGKGVALRIAFPTNDAPPVTATPAALEAMRIGFLVLSILIGGRDMIGEGMLEVTLFLWALLRAVEAEIAFPVTFGAGGFGVEDVFFAAMIISFSS